MTNNIITVQCHKSSMVKRSGACSSLSSQLSNVVLFVVWTKLWISFSAMVERTDCVQLVKAKGVAPCSSLLRDLQAICVVFSTKKGNVRRSEYRIQS